VLPFLPALILSACITSPAHRANSFSPYGTGPAIGVAPVWAISPLWQGAVHFGPTPSDGGWHAAKILWIASPVYRRSVDVDADAQARFADFSPDGKLLRTYQTIRLAGASPGRWYDLPSTVVVGSSGCVSFHVHGLGLTQQITMRAVV
jgi:hypothetical protein